ncbi:MAG: hypothetical protein WBM02_05390 [bacterium]
MKDDSALFSAIAAGDLEAAETFTRRLSAPLFRYCRLNFTDHFRAGDFVETVLASWINRIRSGEIGLQSIHSLFEEASRLSSGQWRGRRGKGLSEKQYRILEIMEEVPLLDRIALDLVLLEHHDKMRVAEWLGLNVEDIDRTITIFLDRLSGDEKIEELLTYAAIQQSRRKRVGSLVEEPRSKRRRKMERVAEASGSSGEESRPARKIWSGREGAGLERDETAGRNHQGSGRDISEDKRVGTVKKHHESRPRRRRVDPREIDVDI